MKKELKISTLSIVCVLCTTIAMPSFGASAVRALGGAGTYSSASSAATAGSKSTGNTASSTRAGSLRVGGAKPATTTSSTRSSAAPRLSIGKYLANSSAIGAGSVSGVIKPGQSGNNNGVEGRVTALEEALGLGDYNGNLNGVFIDIEALEEDLSDLMDVAVTDVVYKDGVLTVVQDGKETTFDLAKDFVGQSEIDALQSAIDAIVVPSLEGYAQLSDLEGLLTASDLSDLEDAVAALKAADTSMDSAIKVLQGGMVTADDLAGKVAELTEVDKDLRAAITALENGMPSTEGLVNKEYVDNLVKGLENADADLWKAIDAISQPDVDKAYVDAAIGSLNLVIEGLQETDRDMAQTIADMKARLDNALTEDDIKDFITSNAVDSKIREAIDGLVTDEEIKDYVTKGALQDEIVKLANKDDIKDFVKSAQVTDAINNAISGLATKEELLDYVKSGDLARLIAAEVAKSDFATKTDLANAKAELQEAIGKINAGQVELENYYTKEAADALFATKSEIPTVPTNVSELDNDAGYITDANLTGLQDAVDANTEDIASLDTAVKSAKSAADAAQSMADLNAVDIKELQDAGYITDAALTDYVKSSDLKPVATSGSYNDLTNKPDLNQYVTNTAVATSIANALNTYEIPDGSITAAKLQQGAVTADKIDTGLADQTMALLISNGDGTSSWVEVTVDAEEQ